MKILFDHQIFQAQRYGGISRYFCEVLKRFPSEHNGYVSVRFSINKHLASLKQVQVEHSRSAHHLLNLQFLPTLLKSKPIRLARKIAPSLFTRPFRLNQEETIRRLQKGEFDIFHPTYYDDYFLPYLGGKPFVLTIHDMIHEKYPELQVDIQTIRMKRNLALKAAHIICVSEHTKRDVMAFYGTPEEHISVIHHGCTPAISEAVSNKDTSSPYFLYVGERDLYKNFSFFIEACVPLLQSTQDVKIVCAGKPFSEFEIELLKTYGISQKVECVAPSDSELQVLYQNALCFVFPSYYEGFGIPILEAFANQCPVILSNTSSFPEVGGDACLYFEPKDLLDIQAKLKQILDSKDLLTSLIQKGMERAKEFPWERSAQQTIGVYERIIHHHR